MPRYALALTSLVLLGICAVAIVRAQDSARSLVVGNSPAQREAAPITRTSYTAEAARRDEAELSSTLQSVRQAVAADYAEPAAPHAQVQTKASELPAFIDAQPLAGVLADDVQTRSQVLDKSGPALDSNLLAADLPSPAAPLSAGGPSRPRSNSVYDSGATPTGMQSVLKRRLELSPSEPSRMATRPTTPEPLRNPEPSRGGLPPAPVSSPDPAPVDSGGAELDSDEEDDSHDLLSSRRTQRMRTAPAPFVSPSPSAQPAVGILSASQSAMVRVETVGPSAMVLGKSAQFTILALNQSDVVARNLHVRVALPPWVELSTSEPTAGATRQQADGQGTDQLVWTIDQLERRGRQQLHLQLVPTENRPFELAVEWTLTPLSFVAQIEVQKPELEVALNGPKDMLFGQMETFTITVSNPGTGQADNVNVQLFAAGSGGKPRSLGAIPAGGQRQIEVELSAQQAGELELTVIAAAEGELRTEAVRTVQVRQAKLEVEITGPPLKFAGNTATYQVRVVNVGDAPAERVSAVATLPQGSKFVPTSEGPQPNAAHTWSLGNLRPGGEALFLINCQLLAAGENRLEVRASGEANLVASKMLTTRVEATADLKLVVNDPGGPKSITEEVVYEIEVINRGTKAAEQVNVIAQFSEGIEPIRGEGSRAELVPGQVLFHPLTRLEPGQKVTLKVTARASTEGTHRFRTEVTCSDPDTRLVSEGSTRFYKLDTPRIGTRPTSVPR